MCAVTHINQRSAVEVRQRLISALGTANQPHQWQVFMRAVRAEMPTILSTGRPSKSAIAASPIGALGFDSWRSFVDTPTEDGGLGLGWSTWRQWARAWAVIGELPALQDAPLSPAVVNRLAAACKKAEISFPSSMSEIEHLEERLAEERRAAAAAAAAGQQGVIDDLRRAAAEERQRTQAQIQELEKQIKTHQTTINLLNNRVKSLMNVGFFGHIAAAFRFK